MSDLEQQLALTGPTSSTSASCSGDGDLYADVDRHEIAAARTEYDANL